jgi:hypothetical protein
MSWEDVRGPPVEGAATRAADVGALAARVSRDTPKVLVQGVGTGDFAVPLTALLSALLNGIGGSGRSDSQNDGSSSNKLHVVGEMEVFGYEMRVQVGKKRWYTKTAPV